MELQDAKRNEYKLWDEDQRMNVRRVAEVKAGNSTTSDTLITDRLASQPLRKSFISYPFVLSPHTKAQILEFDAGNQMRRGLHQEMREAMVSGQRQILPYLLLNVRRDSIVNDTINLLAGYDTQDLKKPLKVIFDGEEGVDAGGVRKEFFQVITRQLLDPSYAMFKYYEESRLIWFSSDNFEAAEAFELVGTLLGIAIHNSIIVDLRLPVAVYKKLKGLASTLDELSVLQPSLAKGLRTLLSFSGDVKSTFETSFQITYEVFGEKKTIDLIPDGGSVFVDESNREQYVELYVKQIMDVSVSQQFEAFARGFQKVCGGAAIDLFEAEELELLICGNPVLDFEELRRGTRYDDGFDEESRVVRDFWEILLQFDEDDKKLFLKFISGSDRSPIDGLSKLGFVISKNGTDDVRLPTAHTCFNHLLLPDYSSREILEEKLKLAISNAEGFGLR